MNRKPLDIDLGTLRQSCAGNRLLACVVWKNPRDAALAQRNNPGELVEKPRTTRSLIRAAVEIRVRDCAIAGLEIDASIETHRGAAFNNSELIHLATRHRDASRQRLDNPAIDRGAAVAAHRADPHVQAAEARVVAIMRGHPDLQPGC